MKAFFFLIVSLLAVSCASLPAIQPVARTPDGTTFGCPSPFLTEKTRFIHAIEVRAAGKTQTVMIGVTLTDPVTRTISCALLSVEGMAFFEASAGPFGMKVGRALPPFDAPDFARNMMNDIELIFLAPPAPVWQKGVLSAGEAICRRHQDQGGWIDVLAGPDGRTRIRRYSESGSLERSVILSATPGGVYSTIELQATNYRLVMTLIESETLQDEQPTREDLKGVRP